jgi:transcriptional regulator with XRE-family HTH domain
MSERTGIPVSTLSKVEHDRLTLTYDKLQQLSHRLNSPSDLFSRLTPRRRADRAPLDRRSGRDRVNTPGEYFTCAELRRKLWCRP